MVTAKRMVPFGVTVFTEINALVAEHGAVNLGQGFPNWDGADFVKEAAIESIRSGGRDQYPPSTGVPELRQAIADRYGPLFGRDLDPIREVTVTSGCTEALAAAFIGLVDPGDEVILIEPFYDSYPVNAAITGAVVRHVTLRPPDFRLDPDELRSVFSERTRAVMVNTPHNPTGRVFDRDELQAIADLCIEFDALVISDEVYEEMTYESEHTRIATLPGMWDRTLTLSSLGKTYSLTGWKLGWAIAPDPLTAGLRSAHQFLTFTTPTPVQYGGVAALGAPEAFYEDLRADYQRRRDLLAGGLTEVGFEVHLSQGTYFLMAGFEAFGFEDDRAFARHMIERAGVAAIPPSAFYSGDGGKGLIRFAFCKDDATLSEAIDRLSRLRV